MNDSFTMEPGDAALAVLDELKRQRSEGIRHLYMEESTLQGLENLLGGVKKESPSIPFVPNQPRFDQVSEPPAVAKVLPDTQAPLQEKTAPVSQPTLKSVNPALAKPPEISLPNGSKAERWNWLKERVLGCEVCQSELNPGAKVVFGVGSLDADLFFCGEAPGPEEEEAGEPFVGPAGELLDKVISVMGLSRESVYLGNVVNFRPRHERAYGNRPPTSDELNFCLPYLKAQLEIIKPKIVVALGKTATDGLLGPDPQRRLGQMRGSWHEYEGIPMMVTYHPSYLLHNPSKSSKRKVWDDMLMVMEKLKLPISEKQRSFFQ
ncbi:uracil-DNA glycosylase [Opitutales bacterium]|nr:uracil-DNA glycosylase [Opitutales bacterium]